MNRMASKRVPGFGVINVPRKPRMIWNVTQTACETIVWIVRNRVVFAALYLGALYYRGFNITINYMVFSLAASFIASYPINGILMVATLITTDLVNDVCNKWDLADEEIRILEQTDLPKIMPSINDKI